MIPSAALIAALNHLLAGQPWLRERLVPFAGRTAVVRMAPLEAGLSIAADGSVTAADPARAPDATIGLPAFAALRLLSGQAAARQEVAVTGDAAFAAALHGVLQALRWDVEEDLSLVVGDVAARRIVAWGEALRAWQRAAADSLAANIAEYLVEERAVLMSRSEVADWAGEVDRLRDDVERLDKRVDRLRRSPRS
jgi:ubiquinone biosynthesis protein UbiJ